MDIDNEMNPILFENIHRTQWLHKSYWSLFSFILTLDTLKMNLPSQLSDLFTHLTSQMASKLATILYQIHLQPSGPTISNVTKYIVYVSCFQSKYSSWHLQERREEWEEGQNVKCRDTKNMKRFVFIWWFIVGPFLESVSTLCLCPFQSYQRHSIKHVSSSAALVLRKSFISHLIHPFSFINRHLAVPPTMLTCHPHFSIPLSRTINSLKIMLKSSNNVARTGQILWPGLGNQHYWQVIHVLQP